MRLFSAENAHWYRRDGEPLHTVMSAKGEPRPTTLRDARKLGLLPSVTNVLGVINKPELVEWKMTQAVLAALTLPRLSGEGEDAFAKRVIEDSQSRVRSAADFGSAFHAGAEQVAKSLEVDQAGPYAAWLSLHRDWFQANCVRVVWTERVLVNIELGYAGTADLLVEHQAYGLTLVDYKTQNGRSGGASLVRLRRQKDRAVEVRFRAVKNRTVSNRNCVTAMWGGEQRNENDQSVTQVAQEGRRRELDSVGVNGRVC